MKCHRVAPPAWRALWDESIADNFEFSAELWNIVKDFLDLDIEETIKSLTMAVDKITAADVKKHVQPSTREARRVCHGIQKETPRHSHSQ